MNLTLPYPPSANRYYRVYQGIARRSREAIDYKAEVAWLARQAGVEPLEGDVVLTMHIYRPRRAGDLDNRIKVTVDALNGIAYSDDSQIVELHAFRHDDRARPRVEVAVECFTMHNT